MPPHWPWSFLVPKVWTAIVFVGGVLSGLIATIDFTSTVTLGSVLTAAVVIIASGLFSFRNNMKTFWRDLAVERQEEIKILTNRLTENENRYRELQQQSRDEATHVAEEQRTIRHDLKAQLAALNKLLEVEHAKTDLSALMEQLGSQHHDAMQRMEEGLKRQGRMLQILEATIPADAIPPDLRLDMGRTDDTAQT